MHNELQRLAARCVLPRLQMLGLTLLPLMTLAGGGCDDTEEAPAGEGAAAPLIGVLELPVSQRTGDPAPASAVDIELSSAALQVAGQRLGELSGGRLPEPLQVKLAEAVAGKSAALLSLHASTPYAATFGAIETLSKAGVDDLVFKVRKPSGTDTGQLALASYGVTDTSGDAVVAIPGAPAKTWGDFTAAWEDVEGACRGSDSGSCAYKPEKIAEGGELKTVLLTAGQGVSVNFYRVGVEDEQAPDEVEEVEAPATADTPSDPAAEVEAAPPATQALFQFRAKEALKSPSAITETLGSVCGNAGCGVVARAEARTPAMRMVSLLGAAFPDGKAPPRVVFEAPR